MGALELAEDVATTRAASTLVEALNKYHEDRGRLARVRLTLKTAELLIKSASSSAPTRRASRCSTILNVAALVLPRAARRDWLEEQRACLGDLASRPAKVMWAIGLLIGMPRYAYTVRTGPKSARELV